MVLIVVVVAVAGVVATAALVAAVVAAQLRRQGVVRAGSEDRQLHQQRLEMRHELDRVSDLVLGLQERQAAQHGEMSARLTDAARRTGELADTARHLREALASPKARGQWGERMAEDVLRLAGFVEGINYRRQTALGSGSIPDVTFLLPGGLLLNMDVKFPADNYLRALEAPDAAARHAAETAFGRDVRQRIKELTGRGYIEPGVTVDHVLLFLPNESIFGFVHEHDPTLVDTALRQKVVLCSPFTLFAVLAVIRQAVEAAQLAQTSDDVLRCLAAFDHQWDEFTAALELVGRRLDTAQRGFEDLAGPRRRQLERQLDRLEDLRRQRGLSDGDETDRSLQPDRSVPEGPPRRLPEARAG